MREDVFFQSGSDRCAAWLYRAEGDGPKPLVILAHGLGAIRDLRLDAYAERFVAAGFSALVFDYRYFGSSEGTPRQLLSVRAQKEDWRAALTYARGLDGIDPKRIALWGTSLSGGHVLEVGAKDGDIAAVVAQTPFTSGIASMWALGVLACLSVGAFAFADLVAKLFRRNPVMVPLMGPRFYPVLIAGDDPIRGGLKMLPAGSEISGRLVRHYLRFFGNRIPIPPHVVQNDHLDPPEFSPWIGSIRMPSGAIFANGISARFGLLMPFLRPGPAIAKLTCPSLIIVGTKDTVTPAKATKAFAAKAPLAGVAEYDTDHFQVYTGEIFEQAVTAQTAFLVRHLGATATRPTQVAA